MGRRVGVVGYCVVLTWLYVCLGDMHTCTQYYTHLTLFLLTHSHIMTSCAIVTCDVPRAEEGRMAAWRMVAWQCTNVSPESLVSCETVTTHNKLAPNVLLLLCSSA